MARKKNPHPRRNGDFWETAFDNRVGYQHYLDRLTELSMCMFDWKGLPDTIDARFLELALFFDGMAVFFKDEVMGYLALQVMIGGQLDVYRIPVDRRAYAVNGYQKALTNTDSVIIFNNLIHTTGQMDCLMFAKRLWKYDEVIDINVNAQKTPVLISCDETDRLTMKNLYMKYEGNEPFIFGDKRLTSNSLQVLSTEAPYIAENLYQLKTEYWNEALSFLGIPNINIQKKERMITDEVTRNMGGTIASRESKLKARKQACEQINKMFGLNISCDFSDVFTEEMLKMEEGVQESES